jgi:hypothetical protein
MATAPRAQLSLRSAVLAGGLALAALTVPAVAALSGPDSSRTTAQGQCLAWFGSRGDGQCIGYSNGNPTYIGTPAWGVFGPGYGNNVPGVTSGPLLPGQTFNQGISP